MNKTAMAEMIEWLQAYEYEIPLELQVKAKELVKKEKEQIIYAYIKDRYVLAGGHPIRTDQAEEHYNQTYNQNK